MSKLSELVNTVRTKAAYELEIPELAPKEPEVSTPELIRTLGIKGLVAHELTAEEQHDNRVRHFLNIPQMPVIELIDPRIKKELIEAGFLWYVTKEFVSKFKYAAGVGTDMFLVGIGQASGLISSYVGYTGDIPEAILDKVDKARQAGIREMTVHSTQPLPISVTKVLPRIDPVIIGWQRKPDIRLNGSFKFSQMLRDYEGVVIGIWDHDKEIEVL